MLVLLVTLEGSQVPPVWSKPHTHHCSSGRVSLLWLWVGEFWPKLELCLVPLTFGAEKNSKDLVLWCHYEGPWECTWEGQCFLFIHAHFRVTHTWASWFKPVVAVGPWVILHDQCLDTPVTGELSELNHFFLYYYIFVHFKEEENLLAAHGQPSFAIIICLKWWASPCYCRAKSSAKSLMASSHLPKLRPTIFRHEFKFEGSTRALVKFSFSSCSSTHLTTFY